MILKAIANASVVSADTQWILDIPTAKPSAAYYKNQPRFSADVEFIPTLRVRNIYSAVQSVHRIYNELVAIVADAPELLTSYFGFTELQTAMWNLSSVQWNGLTRADVFLTKGHQVKIVEVNSDTPSGIDEALLMDSIVEKKYENVGMFNTTLRSTWIDYIDKALHSINWSNDVPTVALLYPTDIPEDMGMICTLREWLEQTGKRVILGQPQNLQLNAEGIVTLFSTPVDMIVRHFKTDWWLGGRDVWSESKHRRQPSVLLKPLSVIAQAVLANRLVVVNPFSTILTQNKLCMAFMHEYRSMFTPDTQAAIIKYIPKTVRLQPMDIEQIASTKDQWVLKSIYGCEGAEVVVGLFTQADEWVRTLRSIQPSEWIAQEYCDFITDHKNRYRNYGVYSVAGTPCGMYVRTSVSTTDNTAVVVPTAYKKPQRDIVAKQTMDSENHHSNTLVEYFRPHDKWISLYEPLLLYSDDTPSAINHNTIQNQMPCDKPYQAGRRLNALLHTKQDASYLLIIVDLPGTSTVQLCSELSATCETILQFNNLATENEAVPLRETLISLLLHKEKFNRKTPAEERIPCIMLDSRRMQNLRRNEVNVFNNRHTATLPEITFLNTVQINHILYIYTGTDITDDIHADCMEYQKSGISICTITLDTLISLPDDGCTLRSILHKYTTVIQPRPTIFNPYIAP